MFRIIYCTVFVNFLIQLCSSARILGIIPSPFYSHQMVFQPLWRELSLRGHQVTLLTLNPLNDPSLTNLTEIDLHFSYDVWNEVAVNKILNEEQSVLQSFNTVVNGMNAVLEGQLQHPQVQELIKNETEHFDLLMLEFFMPPMMAFAAKFKCPVIGLTSVEVGSLAYGMMGNPNHPVLNPDFNLPFQGELTFIERLISTLYDTLGNYITTKYFHILQNDMVERHFGKNYPSIDELMDHASLLFVNANPVFSQVRPLVPAVVQIGSGIHLQPPQPLPEDLQTLLDSASQGVIYFSLGTNVNELSKTTRNMIFETFSELPYLVLCKYKPEDVPNKPENVAIYKWVSQQDVLRHPNIKLFITHGGQQSIEESVFAHIPMVAMPFFGDQPSNVKRLVARGLALSVDYRNFDKTVFKETILEVLDNPKYKDRVKEIAVLAQDQPMTGLEKAIWWTEYVLRHKGAKHLRSPTLDIPFYQYYLLDVIAFCIAILLVLSYLSLVLFRCIYRLVKHFFVKEAKEKMH